MSKSQINQIQKYFLRKSDESTLVSDLKMLAQKWSKSSRDLLLMGIGQDQQQHPALHTVAVAVCSRDM